VVKRVHYDVQNVLVHYIAQLQCQKKDWKAHKVICKRAQEAKKQYLKKLDGVLLKRLMQSLRITEGWQSWVMQLLNIIWVFLIAVAWVWSVDKVESVKWFRLAAEQGLAQAQFNLGNAYSKGEGVSVDKVEGIKWYRLAAEQGVAGAQCNLGVMHMKHGDGCLC
jgi:TPR repeat protein